jgi:hypothetical protein
MRWVHFRFEMALAASKSFVTLAGRGKSGEREAEVNGEQCDDGFCGGRSKRRPYGEILILVQLLACCAMRLIADLRLHRQECLCYSSSW